MGQTIPDLDDKSLFIEECFIDGKWTPTASGKTFEAQDPPTSKLVSTCAECSEEDAHRALAAVEAAFPSFSDLTGRQSSQGSTNVGKLLMQQSSSIIKKLVLELGGNAPFIVFDDCVDIDAAASCLAAKFRSSGQTCHLSIDKAESNVLDAVSKGAVVTIGGAKAPGLRPNFFQPTVLTGLNHDTEIARCETFDPVAALFQFRSEEDVIKMVNDSEVGFAGYLYTQDVYKAWRVYNRLDVGMVGVNTRLISDPATPFGGVTESKFSKEGSKYGLSITLS
ncbi:hypothetical protein ZTR_02136 [Talaromyces verruculosus]|nr:hypothetical protein ZTR_02136 [Talaromyces verruculosus]